MAIHPKLPGIEVAICVDGRPLNEYDDKHDRIEHRDVIIRQHQQKATVSKYIESQTGKEFTIKLCVRSPYQMGCPRLSFKTYVDGQFVKAPMLARTEYGRKFWNEVIVGPESVDKNNLTMAKPMMFGNIDAVSEHLLPNEILKEKRKADLVGEIMIRVYRVSQGSLQKDLSERQSTFSESVATAKYNQKALVEEAKSHATLLGNAKPVEALQVWKTKKLDGEDFPIAIFKFKYRSEESIRQLHLVPERHESIKPTPNIKHRSFEPHADEEDIMDPARLNSLSSAEQKQLQSLLKKMKPQNKAKLVKQEPKEIKQEKNAKSRKRSHPSDFIETIDLTEDNVITVTKKRRQNG